MSISLTGHHPSQKQSLFAIIGIGIAVLLLLILASVYGRFLKTQVAPVATSYAGTGSLKSSVVSVPGTYTLRFVGQDAAGTAVEATSTFEVNENAIGELTTPVPTSSPSAVCTDSDSGVDIYNKGTITFMTPSGSATLTDDCSASTSLVEYSCGFEDDPTRNDSYHSCPSGYICSDGACRNSVSPY